jgi:hypothetical protein
VTCLSSNWLSSWRSCVSSDSSCCSRARKACREALDKAGHE